MIFRNGKIEQRNPNGFSSSRKFPIRFSTTNYTIPTLLKWIDGTGNWDITKNEQFVNFYTANPHYVDFAIYDVVGE